MMIEPRFVFPYALLLLALIPLAIYLGMQIRSLSAGRKWTVITLRVIILLALILALAGVEIVRKNDTLAVFFLLDQSNSIPEEVRLAAVDSVRAIADLYMERDDEAGAIVFGDEASIELSVGETLELGEIHSYVGGEQTDLAAAMRLAMAAYPEGYMKRMVIYTDGNETQGSALEEAKVAQAAGVEVDVVPLIIEGGNEVRIREVSTPANANADEPFDVNVVVRSDQETDAVLRLSRQSRGGREAPIEQRVTLQPGDNVFRLPQELTSSGFYEYEATIETPDDTILANNAGQSFSVVYGEPSVLYVERDAETSPYLIAALQEEGIAVTMTNPGGMPTSLAQLQNYDAVIMSDVSGTDLSTPQMQSIEAMVRDLGIGLVMIGGPNSFGAGGFHESPVERALPVDMDLKQRKVLPRGALALILHTVEIPDGNAWARDIGLAALNVLAAQDLMGALAYTYDGGDEWLFTLQPVGDKAMMRNQISRADIGDMPAVGPTLHQAYKALSEAQAAAKRVVIISDGDPAAPPANLVRALKAATISVSTICIAPHSLNDQQMLRWVAEQTGGNYYFVNNPNNLPQIFTKEAAIVKRGLLIEEKFQPQAHHDSELLRGGFAAGWPQLLGYVATTPKETSTVALISHEDDPVLAHWRYGLGKSVAFTSDVTTRWARDWVTWEGFSSFWAQNVRWAMRDLSKSSFRIDTTVRDGKGVVRIDAVDDQGRFINGLRPEAVITGPGPDFERSTAEFMQTGPGIYETTFPADARGVYMMNIMYEDGQGNQGMVPAGLSVGYSQEYEYNTTNRSLLEQVAVYGGGDVVPPLANVFENDLPAAAAVTPIWQWLLVLAVCLFPIEIFIRRVMIDYAALFARSVAWVRFVPVVGRRVRLPQGRERSVTGVYGTRQAREFEFARADGGSGFGGDIAAREPGDTGGATRPVTEAQQAAKEEAKPAGGSDYTRQLLAAKERALKKKRDEQDSDKEKE